MAQRKQERYIDRCMHTDTEMYAHRCKGGEREMCGQRCRGRETCTNTGREEQRKICTWIQRNMPAHRHVGSKMCSYRDVYAQIHMHTQTHAHRRK